MKRIISLLLSALVLLCGAALSEGRVIVSLGDSYSSGEGIEPFYGQDAEMAVKCLNQDWLAHRSEKSWPGMLVLPGVDGPMKNHRGENWFFAAASGAELNHLFLLAEEETEAGMSARQEREYNRNGVSGVGLLDPQLDIFDELDRLGLKADYVTVTIGGNDIGFQRIVAQSMLGITVLLPGETIGEKAEALWNDRYTANGIRAKIKRVYHDIAARAGSQACIIVADYPLPVAEDGGENGYPEESARIMNAAAGMFNEEIRDIVEECRREGLNIRFVSVEAAFEGHGAYSEDPYINPVYTGIRDQDLRWNLAASYYSMHPNEKGAEAYARCVQEVIDALESGREVP